MSPSTVSRILNSPDNSFASEEVRNRVWQVVQSVGYTPNETARNLRMKKNDKKLPSKTIACIFARTKNPMDNPFFSQIARAIEQQAISMGYVVSYSFSAFDIENTSIIERIVSTSVDGVVVLGKFSTNIMRFLNHHYKNIIYVGLNNIDVCWDQVICDGYEAAICAMRYLIKMGHHSIAYLGEIKNEVRFQAYADALAETGIKLDKKLMVDCESGGSGGYTGALALLKSDAAVSAIFCINDITAIAAIKYIRERKLNVPKDISVISIDDIEMAQYVTPMLTTVKIPKSELGKMAVKTLVDRIERGHRLSMKVTLPHNLIIRESVRAINKIHN